MIFKKILQVVHLRGKNTVQCAHCAEGCVKWGGDWHYSKWAVTLELPPICNKQLCWNKKYIDILLLQTWYLYNWLNPCYRISPTESSALSGHEIVGPYLNDCAQSHGYVIEVPATREAIAKKKRNFMKLVHKREGGSTGFHISYSELHMYSEIRSKFWIRIS